MSYRDSDQFFGTMSNGKYAVREVGNTEAYKIFVGNPEGKRHLAGHSRRREDDRERISGLNSSGPGKDPGTSFIYLTVYLATQSTADLICSRSVEW
jgi:hypothetical protein